jgi:hypothetical protein
MGACVTWLGMVLLGVALGMLLVKLAFMLWR